VAGASRFGLSIGVFWCSSRAAYCEELVVSALWSHRPRQLFGLG
jgi:hypothetical protein